MMGLLYLSETSKRNAADYCDQHLARACLSYAQVLATVQRLWNVGALSRNDPWKGQGFAVDSPEVRSPIVQWALEPNNYLYLCALWYRLNEQYMARFNKKHHTHHHLRKFLHISKHMDGLLDIRTDFDHIGKHSLLPDPYNFGIEPWARTSYMPPSMHGLSRSARKYAEHVIDHFVQWETRDHLETFSVQQSQPKYDMEAGYINPGRHVQFLAKGKYLPTARIHDLGIDRSLHGAGESSTKHFPLEKLATMMAFRYEYLTTKARHMMAMTWNGKGRLCAPHWFRESEWNPKNLFPYWIWETFGFETKEFIDSGQVTRIYSGQARPSTRAPWELRTEAFEIPSAQNSGGRPASMYVRDLQSFCKVFIDTWNNKNSKNVGRGLNKSPNGSRIESWVSSA